MGGRPKNVPEYSLLVGMKLNLSKYNFLVVQFFDMYQKPYSCT